MRTVRLSPRLTMTCGMQLDRLLFGCLECTIAKQRRTRDRMGWEGKFVAGHKAIGSFFYALFYSDQEDLEVIHKQYSNRCLASKMSLKTPNV